MVKDGSDRERKRGARKKGSKGKTATGSSRSAMSVFVDLRLLAFLNPLCSVFLGTPFTCCSRPFVFLLSSKI